MAQRRKDEVRERIEQAALDAFARRGFRAATMVDVAAQAGISTGNIYRYFATKQDLYDAVVPASFVASLQSKVRRRVRALRGVRDLRTLRASAPYHVISGELLDLCIANRSRLVALVEGSTGTRNERFADRMVEVLSRLAAAHFRDQQPSARLTATQRFLIAALYRNFLRTLVGILRRSDSEASIRQAVDELSRYHLAGLKAFFEGGMEAWHGKPS